MVSTQVQEQEQLQELQMVQDQLQLQEQEEQKHEQVQKQIKDVNSEIALKLIESCIGNEIKSICDNIDTFGATAVSNKSLGKLVYKMKNAYHNVIKDYDIVRQELFLLHQICGGLYEFNTEWVQYTYVKYRSVILFPNLIYLLVKYFNTAQRFLRKSIQKIHLEYNQHYYGIIQKYTTSYYIDAEVIQNDILCRFLGNALLKFNPLDIKKLNIFYHQIFRSSYFYYFKSKENFNVNYYKINEIDFNISRSNNVPVKLKLYRDILYKLQIKKIVKEAPIMMQLNYNYNIFKNIIISNEFQSLYYSTINDSILNNYKNNNHFNLLNIYKHQLFDDEHFLKKLQKLPIIFKLLKCIHIYNNKKTSSHNVLTINSGIVKTFILEELLIQFKQLFSNQYVYEILENTAQNFVDNILCGEYINPITFNNFVIQDYSFIIQLREFVKLCIEHNSYQ